MMKKLVVLLACLSLSLQLTGCTSNESQSDSEAAVDLESADLEQLEGDEALEIASDDTVSVGDDPAAALGETDMSSTPDAGLEIADTSDSLPADPFAEAPAADVPATDPMISSSTSDPMPEPETPSMVESTTSTETETTVSSTFPGSDSSSNYSESIVEPAVKANVPLQKVPTAPWKSGGTLYNTVYFAKPGDSLSSISQLIYGNSSKVSELKRGNASFASRDVRPFDKVYYNSPLRPSDDAQMITYYADNGLSPEVYVAESGDNIRTVSSRLLGHPQAWKEVWASNSVDSKGEIPAGTELKYWRPGSVAAAPAPTQEMASSQPPQDMGMNNANEMPPVEAPTMAGTEDTMMPPPPMPEDPMAMAQNEMPPPPPMPDATSEMPPPPPPVEAFNPPAPPQDMAMEEEAPMDNNSTMALGVVGIAAAGLAALVVMRKKRRQRELEQQAFDSTQVGT